SEADVVGFSHKYQLPVCKSPCPADGFTKREYAKELARQLNREHPGAAEHMFSAIINGNIPNWPTRTNRSV
ncbi:MAG: tRNA 2-thiocytidine(32) synthetase TtcA, partial [Clostridiales bacterium]|nr:tRNA 2-thiocytidine(32) synthetase TtcA [Clostridiales bacterium]